MPSVSNSVVASVRGHLDCFPRRPFGKRQSPRWHPASCTPSSMSSSILSSSSSPSVPPAAKGLHAGAAQRVPHHSPTWTVQRFTRPFSSRPTRTKALESPSPSSRPQFRSIREDASFPISEYQYWIHPPPIKSPLSSRGRKVAYTSPPPSSYATKDDWPGTTGAMARSSGSRSTYSNICTIYISHSLGRIQQRRCTSSPSKNFQPNPRSRTS